MAKKRTVHKIAVVYGFVELECTQQFTGTKMCSTSWLDITCKGCLRVKENHNHWLAQKKRAEKR